MPEEIFFGFQIISVFFIGFYLQWNAGVYVVVNKGVAVNKQDAGDIKQLQQQLMQQNSNVFPQAFMRSLQNNADIKDYRIQVYDLAGH